MTFICGRGWGIGINFYEDGITSYGFPEQEDPNKFYPDREMTTEEEYNNWLKACKEWNTTS